MQARDETLRRPVLTPVLTGVAALGAFYGCALVARRVPVLDSAICSVLAYAHQGNAPLVLLTTVANEPRRRCSSAARSPLLRYLPPLFRAPLQLAA